MQFQSILVIVTLMYLGYVAARISKELRITLPNGSKLLGRGLRSHDGRSIRAFIGIPYAKPPVGELRFKVIIKLTSCPVMFLCFSFIVNRDIIKNKYFFQLKLPQKYIFEN